MAISVGTNFLLGSLSLLAGVLLGLISFGGLWWTVSKGLTSAPSVSGAKTALWFLGSRVLRTAIILSGIYLVSSGDWRRLLLCFAGLLVGRTLVTRFTRTKAPGIVMGASHAT